MICIQRQPDKFSLFLLNDISLAKINLKYLLDHQKSICDLYQVRGYIISGSKVMTLISISGRIRCGHDIYLYIPVLRCLPVYITTGCVGKFVMF